MAVFGKLDTVRIYFDSDGLYNILKLKKN